MPETPALSVPGLVNIASVCDELKKNIKVIAGELAPVLSALKEELDGATDRLAPAVKRATWRRSLKHVEKSCRQLKDSEAKVSDARSECGRLSSLLTDALRQQDESSSRSEALATSLRIALENLAAKEETSARTSEEAHLARAELQTAQKHIELLEQERRSAREEVEGLRAQLGSVSSTCAQLRSESLSLRTAHGEAAALAAEREGERNAAASEAAEVAEQVERYKEVVARLTADNVLFLLKLRSRDGDLDAARRQTAEQQAQVEAGRDAWLQEARAEVEAAVRGTLLQLQSVQADMADLRERSASQLAALGERLQSAEGELGREREESAALRGTLADTESRMAAAAEQLQECAARVEAEEQLRRDTQAEVRVLSKTVGQLEVERLAHEKLKQDMQVLKQHDEEAHVEHKQLLADLEASAAAVRRMQGVNEALMKRKAEVEWQLLELQAQAAQLAPGDSSKAPRQPMMGRA